MNKRFEELAEQCHHRYSEHNIDLEKFAKLILSECIDLCEDARFKQTNTVPKEYANRRINMCILTIKERFGVE
jgi:hypothetical protein